MRAVCAANSPLRLVKNGSEPTSNASGRRSAICRKASALDAAFLDADFAAWHLHRHPKLALRPYLADDAPFETLNVDDDVGQLGHRLAL